MTVGDFWLESDDGLPITTEGVPEGWENAWRIRLPADHRDAMGWVIDWARMRGLPYKAFGFDGNGIDDWTCRVRANREQVLDFCAFLDDRFSRPNVFNEHTRRELGVFRKSLERVLTSDRVYIVYGDTF